MSVTTTAYSQWIALQISNDSKASSIYITQVSLNWGKLYDGTNKDHDVGTGKVTGTEIKAGESYTIHACGKDSSASGTEGTVTISTARTGGSKIVAIHWDSPWSGNNNLDKQGAQLDGWIVDVPGVESDGAIGHVEATFIKKRD